MDHPSRNSSLVFILCLSLIGAVCSQAEEAKPFTIEQAKFEMLKLYSAAELPNTKLRTKYPAVRKADTLAREAGKDYSKAILDHPKLKEAFDQIRQQEISFAEKIKLQKPLFEKAETLPSLDKLRASYHHTRLLALKEEISALRSEGHKELADGMAAILSQVKE